MNSHGENAGVPGQDVAASPRPPKEAGQGGGAEPISPVPMVDRHHGAGRDNTHRQEGGRGGNSPSSGISLTIPDMVIFPKQSFRIGRGKGFQPGRLKSNAQGLAMHIQRHAPREPWTGPVAVEIIAGFPLRKKEIGIVREVGWDWKCTKPDCDNLAKQVLDVLQGCGFFKDDSQVARLAVTKLRMAVPVTRICLFRIDASYESGGPWLVLKRPSGEGLVSCEI